MDTAAGSCRTYAVFCDPFGADPAGAAGKAGLTTDNVGSDSDFLAAFPYLATRN